MHCAVCTVPLPGLHSVVQHSPSANNASPSESSSTPMVVQHCVVFISPITLPSHDDASETSTTTGDLADPLLESTPIHATPAHCYTTITVAITRQPEPTTAVSSLCSAPTVQKRTSPLFAASCPPTPSLVTTTQQPPHHTTSVC